MGIKTRYLQISDTTMLEYCVADGITDSKLSGLYCTKYKNGHYGIFSHTSAELPSDENYYSYNNINHLAVPVETDESEWFTFIDPDLKYSPEDPLVETDVKCNEYFKYFSKIDKYDSSVYRSFDVSTDRTDKVVLYFNTGYDFSDIYGALVRISVVNTKNEQVDLCSVFYDKSSVYKYISYLSQPIIFGNFIYDKKLEIDILSISNIPETLQSLLSISPNAPIKLMFAYIDSESKNLSNIEYNIEQTTLNSTPVHIENCICKFSRTSVIKGTIPTESLSSDNLGVYIALNESYGYVEFYGTWKTSPLTFDIVQNFNKTIFLYDTSLVRKNYKYEVSSTYTAENDLKKWIAVHEITCNYLNISDTGNIGSNINPDTYTVTQVFDNNTSLIPKFYYRPLIFNEDKFKYIDTIAITYVLRLINIEDNVQFTKRSSLSIDKNNIFKYWAKGTNLSFENHIPYKVYNKINKIEQTLNSNLGKNIQTKYVKIFYNSTDVVVDENGTVLENNSYTLNLQSSPKTYKFVFKEKSANNTLKYMDLSGSYYKLYAKDSNNNDILIEPTYSTNMNMLLGELEFNISSSNLLKLMNVPEANRNISIIITNPDNSISTLYSMKYTIN